MPTDITGTEVIQEDKQSGTRELRFIRGPIFGNVILADEINRTPPKTQAALLEAMQERQVTVGRNRHVLSDPFFVLATQNPIEQEGTYPLPEAQQDRFMFKVFVEYPNFDEEFEVARRTTGKQPDEVEPVLDGEQIRLQLQGRLKAERRQPLTELRGLLRPAQLLLGDQDLVLDRLFFLLERAFGVFLFGDLGLLEQRVGGDFQGAGGIQFNALRLEFILQHRRVQLDQLVALLDSRALFDDPQNGCATHAASTGLDLAEDLDVAAALDLTLFQNDVVKGGAGRDLSDQLVRGNTARFVVEELVADGADDADDDQADQETAQKTAAARSPMLRIEIHEAGGGRGGGSAEAI